MQLTGKCMEAARSAQAAVFPDVLMHLLCLTKEGQLETIELEFMCHYGLRKHKVFYHDVI